MSSANPSSSAPPVWARNRTIYQVNLRQFTPEGTLRAFSEHLPRLRDLGVGILWFMPIHPIGRARRKGSLGSYYAVRDYRRVNPEFGTVRDFDRVVRQCHELGLKVILDWVPNHTAWDHAWVMRHPEWYRRDAGGEIEPPVPDWDDVAQLDYGPKDGSRLSFSQRALWNQMQDEMAWWVDKRNVDGFRCDVAAFLPMRFWRETRRKLRRPDRQLFWLAEADGPEIHDRAFDASYGWTLQRGLDAVAARRAAGKTIIRSLRKDLREYPNEALRMQMTSNHDANSWDGSAITRLGATGAEMGAVLTFLFPGIPLIYNGQEAGIRHRLAFFEKDEIPWRTHRFRGLYQRLITWRRNHPALLSAPETQIRFLESSDEDVLAFMRRNGDATLCGVFVLRPKPKEAMTVEIKGVGIATGSNAHAPRDEVAAPRQGVLTLQRVLTKATGPKHETPPAQVEVRRGLRLSLRLGPWGYCVWSTPIDKLEGRG